jgi:phospholipid transport system substrate-binding protein
MFLSEERGYVGIFRVRRRRTVSRIWLFRRGKRVRRAAESRLWRLACGLWLCAATTAWAATPLEHTRAVLEKTRQIVDSERSHNEKLAELSVLLKGFLDTDAMGRAALDTHWSQFSPAQQKEFLTLFRELFQRTYVQKLLLFEKPDFAYVGETVGAQGAQVDTKIVTPRDEFAVTYAMRLQGGEWLATDIKIEDLSLTANFRRQLDQLLSKSSPENVLDRMRRKYGPGGAGSDEGL